MALGAAAPAYSDRLLGLPSLAALALPLALGEIGDAPFAVEARM